MGISVSLQGRIKMFSEHWDFWLLNMDSIVEILRIVSRRSRKLHLNSRGKELILETPNRNFLYGINLIIGICQKKNLSNLGISKEYNHGKCGNIENNESLYRSNFCIYIEYNHFVNLGA